MMKAYSEYKDSEIEWLGNVPEDWSVKRLKFLSHIKTGEKDTVNREENGKYPFFVRADTVESINSYSYDGEAVLTAGDGVGVGRVFHYINGKFDYHQRVYKVSDFTEITGKYFFYFMKENFHKEVMKISAKSTVDSLRLPMFLDFPVAFGSIKEQQTIANFLDRKTRQIDTLIEKKQKMIELLKEERTAVINHSVTKGLNPDVKMKDSGIEWLGEIPEHWEVKPLKYLLKDGKEGIKIGPFGSSLKLEIMKPTGIKVYGQENIIRDNFTAGNKFIDKQKFAELSVYEILADDIVVTMMGTTGKSKVIPQGIAKGIMDSHLIRMRVNNSTTPELIALLINDSYYLWSQIKQNSKGSIMEGLNSGIIKSLLIAYASLAEQKKILSYLKIKLQRIEKTVTDALEQIELLNEYRTALISEAVTGKIDVRDEVIA